MEPDVDITNVRLRLSVEVLWALTETATRDYQRLGWARHLSRSGNTPEERLVFGLRR
jgi:hypothetical protein